MNDDTPGVNALGNMDDSSDLDKDSFDQADSDTAIDEDTFPAPFEDIESHFNILGEEICSESSI